MFTLIPLAITALLSTSVIAQGDLTETNNVTSLEGTWSSNSAVSTGGSFCTPAEMKFEYPTNTGMSISFTGDGFFEEAAYRYESNASNPSCIQAIIWWHHGTYTLNNNGSISLSPFPGDGRIQVQNPCAAVTNVITYYDQFTLYADWGIVIDYTTGNYQLRMNRFDGAKLPYMDLIARPANMLPTQPLTGVNASGQTIQTRKRSLVQELNIFKRSAAPSRLSFGQDTLAAGAIGVAVVGIASLGLGLL